MSDAPDPSRPPSADPRLSDAPSPPRLGQLAVHHGIITSQQLEECLQELRAAQGQGEAQQLGQVLIRRRLISAMQLAWLLTEQKRLAEQAASPAPGPVLTMPDLPTFDRYDVQAKLGEGATAAVYRAYDRSLNRHVALKLLHESSTEKGQYRFLREARVAAGLSHPNLISVFDVGEVEGRLYIVMEMVEGESLETLLQNHAVGLPQQIALLEQVARGVGVAHEQGIVHRDLKPANILVTREGEPKVGDFGLAHLADSGSAITATGAALGTPLYMSPEQVRAKPDQITPRADVYALGAILYEMLTGRPPHKGHTIVEIYSKILTEEPVPPHKINPQADRNIELICLKALDSEPSRRYAHATELADDLRRWCQHEAVLARPAGTLTRMVKMAKRHRNLSVTASLAAAVLLATAAYALNHAVQLRRQVRSLLARAEAAERQGRFPEAAELYVQVRTLWPGHSLAETKAAKMRDALIAQRNRPSGSPRWRSCKQSLSASLPDHLASSLSLSSGSTRLQSTRCATAATPLRSLSREELLRMISALRLPAPMSRHLLDVAAGAVELRVAGDPATELTFYVRSDERLDELIVATAPTPLSKFTYFLEMVDGVTDVTLAPEGHLEVRDDQGLARLRMLPPRVLSASGMDAWGALRVNGRSPTPPQVLSLNSARELDLSLELPSPPAWPILIHGTWTTTSRMAVARKRHAGVRLQDGRILVVGGQGAAALSSCEIFDPPSETWTSTAGLPPGEERCLPQLTLLQNGQVFLCGGHDSSKPLAFKSAFVWNPAGFGTWTATADPMAVERALHRAVLLSDGRVLIVGGGSAVEADGAVASPVAVCELYHPDSNTFSPAAPMAVPRMRFDMIDLHNDTVLVAGGFASDGATNECALYTIDAGAGRWERTSALPAPRADPALLRLPAGRVLLAGGHDGSRPSAECSVYAEGTWSAAANLPEAMDPAGCLAAPVSLGTGVLLTIGGADNKVYRYEEGRWSARPAMTARHDGAVALRLDEGRVIVIGGGTDQELRADAEIYDDEVGGTTPPLPPTDLEQRAGPLLLPDTETTSEGALTFRALVTDADGDAVRLQVEIKPVGCVFDGVDLIASEPVSSGQRASVAGKPLAADTYRWRARALDARDCAGAWVEFEQGDFEAADVEILPRDPMSGIVLGDETFKKWRDYVLPTPDELRWRDIPWRPSLWQGFVDAQKEEKPILLWAMDGHPLAAG
ncbi:MAG: protein kinase [Planctomycetes bacterium]|nr:protein kinase [Planctomycetota bacterium]